MRYLIFLVMTALFSASVPVFAASVSERERIDQLERDVLILQRKISRQQDMISEGPIDDVTGMPSAAGASGMVALEEEMRSLRGQIEERDHEIRKLKEEMEMLKRDMEFRLSELEQGKPSDSTGSSTEKAAEEVKTRVSDKMELSVKDTSDGSSAPRNIEVNFDSSRDHYNFAFRLLNQNQYDEAGKYFQAFIESYPNDPLIGNAYYWLGETYYIREKYAEAINQFRQGFEALPNGPKAPDNLLKLGMSLARAEKKQEACIILSQVKNKYQSVSANTANKAASEHKRIACE